MKILLFVITASICFLWPSAIAQEVPEGSIRPGFGYEQSVSGKISLGEKLNPFFLGNPHRVVSELPANCFDKNTGITRIGGIKSLQSAVDFRADTLMLASFTGGLFVECGQDKIWIDPVAEIYFEEFGWRVLNTSEEEVNRILLHHWSTYFAAENDSVDLLVTETASVSFLKKGTMDASFMCLVNGQTLFCAFDSDNEADRDNLQHALKYKGYSIQDINMDGSATDRRTGVTMGKTDAGRPFSSLAALMMTALDIELLGASLSRKRIEIGFGEPLGPKWREQVADERLDRE